MRSRSRSGSSRSAARSSTRTRSTSRSRRIELSRHLDHRRSEADPPEQALRWLVLRRGEEDDARRALLRRDAEDLVQDRLADAAPACRVVDEDVVELRASVEELV